MVFAHRCAPLPLVNDPVHAFLLKETFFLHTVYLCCPQTVTFPIMQAYDTRKQQEPVTWTSKSQICDEICGMLQVC